MSTRSSPQDTLPEALSGPLEKLVYLYVLQHGQTTVRDLRDALGVPQLRLYPTVASMARNELVERDGDAVWLPEVDAADPLRVRP